MSSIKKIRLVHFILVLRHKETTQKSKKQKNKTKPEIKKEPEELMKTERGTKTQICKKKLIVQKMKKMQ